MKLQLTQCLLKTLQSGLCVENGKEVYNCALMSYIVHVLTLMILLQTIQKMTVKVIAH